MRKVLCLTVVIAVFSAMAAFGKSWTDSYHFIGRHLLDEFEEETDEMIYYQMARTDSDALVELSYNPKHNLCCFQLYNRPNWSKQSHEIILKDAKGQRHYGELLGGSFISAEQMAEYLGMGDVRIIINADGYSYKFLIRGFGNDDDR